MIAPVIHGNVAIRMTAAPMAPAAMANARWLTLVNRNEHGTAVGELPHLA